MNPGNCLFTHAVYHVSKTTLLWFAISSMCINQFLPERDYVTFGSLLSQIRMSVVCLSVLNIRAAYSGVEAFGNSHLLTSVENFTEIIPGEPLCLGR